MQAQGYWLELYQLPDRALLSSEPVSSTDWQRPLPNGEYELVVRAVDDQGVRGREAVASVTVAPAAVPTPEPEPQPAQPQKDGPDWRGMTLFLLGTAIMLL